MESSKKRKRMVAISQAKRQKAIRIYRAEHGLCTNCGKPVDREGKLCTACLEKKKEESKQRREFYKSKGICPECGKYEIFPHESMCPECNAKRITREEKRSDYSKEYQKKLRDKRKAEGKCVECGKNPPEEEGGYLCSFCKEKRRKAAKRKPKKYIVANRVSDRLCARCDRPALPGLKLCEEHYRIQLESVAKREKAYASGGKERKINPKWKGTNEDLIINARRRSRPSSKTIR